MLDPLTALGLVSNVLQFVDFGGKMLLAAYQAYESTTGTSQANIGIALAEIELTDLMGKLAATSVVHSSDPSSQAALQRLAQNCLTTADEMQLILDKLIVHSHGKARALEAIKVTIISVMATKDIQKLQKRLQGYRDMATSRLIFMLRDDQSSTKAAIEALDDKSTRMQLRNETQLSGLQQELLSAVDSNKRLYAKTSDMLTDAASHQQALQAAVDKIAALLEQSSQLATSLSILESLQFTQMRERRSRIKET